MADDRKRKGDRYPGVTHPAVAAVKCPTCRALPGKPCKTIKRATTRTHRTRLNLWRVEKQSERAR